MEHDFKKYPELTNRQMEELYFKSPHKQITENFEAQVVKVIDGDTIKLKADFRDFEFTMRLQKINAPELSEQGGIKSREWLRKKIENKIVEIIINYNNRVDKFGRLLGDILFMGELITEASLRDRESRLFGELREGGIPELEDYLK